MEFNLNNFTGPLDILLSLIQEKKKDISEVAISEVTDQFLQYLDTLPENDANEIADFLVVAARLLYLKSKTLLPNFLPEEDMGPSLADQLRLYQRFVAVSKDLQERWLDQHFSVYHVETPQIVIPEGLPKNVSLESLLQSMELLVKRLRPPKPLPETKIDRTVSLKEKIDRIRSLLQKGKEFSFLTMTDRQNKTDLIVSFLAVLELVKLRMATMHQSDHFGDIMITPSRTH